MKSPIIETSFWLIFIAIIPLFVAVYWGVLLLTNFLLHFTLPIILAVLVISLIILSVNSKYPIFIHIEEYLLLAILIKLGISFISKESDFQKKIKKNKTHFFNSIEAAFLKVLSLDKRIAEKILTYGFIYILVLFSSILLQFTIANNIIPIDINYTLSLAYFIVSLKAIYEFEKSKSK